MVKAMVFPVIMYQCELAHKEDEALGNLCFQIMVLENSLERRLDGKERKSDYSLEGMKLKRKLQYFGHGMQRSDSFEKTLMLGNISEHEFE